MTKKVLIKRHLAFRGSFFFPVVLSPLPNHAEFIYDKGSLLFLLIKVLSLAEKSFLPDYKSD